MNKQFCPYCMNPVAEGETCRSCGLTEGNYTPNQNHLPPGTILNDRYLVGRVLGEGGFGITYIGCDLRLEMKVAIKEYFPVDKAQRISEVSLEISVPSTHAQQSFRSGKERFLEEARVMARMDKQPEIVGVRDFFECHNTAYIVMEYVEGTTFKQLVAQRGGGIPAKELLPMVEPLFGALSNLHALGLIHRDISPDNLMLEQGRVRLIDFGCARQPEKGEATMTIILKHGYAPIEQYTNRGQGPWTDVYALSATLYYCLVGQTPPQAMDRAVEDELVLPRKLGVDLTEGQEAALLRGMGIKRRQRWDSVQALYEALYAAPEQEATAKKPEAPQHSEAKATEEKKTAPQKKLPLWLPVAAVLLCAALLAVWLLPTLRNQKQEPAAPEAPVLEQPVEQPEEPSDQPVEPEAPIPSGLAPLPGDPAAIFGDAQVVDSPDRDLNLVLMDGPAVVQTEDGHYRGDRVLSNHLKVGAGAELTFDVPVTIPAGALLLVQGQVRFLETAYVERGARILLLDQGQISGDVILEAQSAALSGSSAEALTASMENGGSFYDLQLDMVETSAVHVDTEEALLTAAEDPECSAIVVDAGTELILNETLKLRVPLVLDGSLRIIYRSGDRWNTLRMDEAAMVINHGSLEAMVFDETEKEGGHLLLVNRGEAQLGCEAYGLIFNDGSMYVRNMFDIYSGSSLYNLAELDASDESLWVRGGKIRNSGYMEIGDGLTVISGGQLVNTGEMVAFTDTDIFNEGYFGNFGTLELQSGSLFNNEGVLELPNGNTLLRENRARFDNNGMIHTNDAEFAAAVDGAVVYHEASLNQDGQAAVTAENEAAFLAALEDDTVDLIRIDSHVTVQSSVTVTKKLEVLGTLTMAEGTRLELCGETHIHGQVEGPEVHVHGQKACVTNHGLLRTPLLQLGEASNSGSQGAVLNYGQIQLDRGALHMDGESNLILYGSVENCALLHLEYAAKLAQIGYLQLEDADVLVDARLILLGEQDLHNCRVEISSDFYGGNLMVRARRLALYGTTMRVNNVGHIGVEDCEFILDSASVLDNHGSITIFGSSFYPVFEGKIINRDELAIGSPVIFNGPVENHMEVEFYEYGSKDYVFGPNFSWSGQAWKEVEYG